MAQPQGAAAHKDVGQARPPLWAKSLSKVRVMAKDTLDYTFQSGYTPLSFITLHRCIFREVYLRSLTRSVKIHRFDLEPVYLRMKIHRFGAEPA